MSLKDVDILRLAILEKRHDCFEKVYRQYFQYSFKIAYTYLNNADDAADVAQQAWIKIWEKGHKWDRKFSFVTFLRNIVVNTSIDFIRKRKHEVPHEIELHEKQTAIQESTLKLEIKQLLLFIERLSYPSREVVKLFFIEGYSHADIAEKLGISENHSRVLLSNAKSKINQHFQELEKKTIKNDAI